MWYNIKLYEVWLSLVEYYVRDVGVASSNLVIPTKRQSFFGCRFFLYP